MPWVRIDENAMDDPKFLALSDGAWRLWCEGQSYCQKHLTDGDIPLVALKGFRYYSPSRVRCLLTVHVPDKAALWEQDTTGTVHVHDYLEWNDSREHVLAARAHARERMAKLRGSSPVGSREQLRERTGERTLNVRCTTSHHSTDTKPLTGAEAPAEAETAPQDPNLSPPPDGREVGAFLKRFCELFSQYRHGAKYHVERRKDIPLVRQLLALYGRGRLEKLAMVLLTTDDPWVDQTDRGIGILSVKASWLDGRLSAYESEHGTIQVA